MENASSMLVQNCGSILDSSNLCAFANLNASTHADTAIVTLEVQLLQGRLRLDESML